MGEKVIIVILSQQWPPPFVDALHFVCIHMYTLVIYDVTEAPHSLGIEVHILPAQEEVIVT